MWLKAVNSSAWGLRFGPKTLSTDPSSRRRSHPLFETILAIPPRAAAAGALLPPRATADGTLRRLQEAALIGFGERGYNGVSIRDLATAAGVKVSSVYAHVSAKEDLLLELMLLGHREHNERLRRALLDAEPEPADQIRALVRAHVEMHAIYPLLGRICNKELHALSAANSEQVMQIRLDSERMFLDVVNRGVDLGIFRCEDPWMAVAAIGGMGLRVAEWYDPAGSRTVAHVADAYSNFAVKLLR